MAVKAVGAASSHKGFVRSTVDGFSIPVAPYPVTMVWNATVDVNTTGVYQTFFAFGPDSFTGSDYYTCAIVASTTPPRMSVGFAGGDNTYATAPTAGKWMRHGFRATRPAGGGAPKHEFYVDLPSKTRLASGTALDPTYFSTGTQNMLRVMDVPWATTETLNGKMAGFKAWFGVYMTPEDMAIESLSPYPVLAKYLPFLWVCLPMRNGDDHYDISGRGHHFYVPKTPDVGNKPTTIADPPYFNYTRAPSGIFLPKFKNSLGAKGTSAAVTTYVVNTGVYSLTGQNAGLFRSLSEPANKGTYVLTGINANLLKVSNLGISKGTYLLTGISVNLLRSLLIQPSKGVYSLTGINANLFKASIYSVSNGTYLLTGQAVNLLFNRVLSAVKGTFILTGINIGLLYNRISSVSKGVYSLTGISANLLRVLNSSETTGVYLLSGKSVNLLKSSILTPNTGIYSLTGINALLAKLGAGSAGTGTFNLTGQNAGLHYNRDFVASTGNYLLSGKSAILVSVKHLDFAKGIYNLTGQNADLSVSHFNLFPTGIYQLLGQAANLSLSNRQFGVNTGVYALIGKNANLRKDSGYLQSLARTYVVSSEIRTYHVAAESRIGHEAIT